MQKETPAGASDTPMFQAHEVGVHVEKDPTCSNGECSNKLAKFCGGCGQVIIVLVAAVSSKHLATLYDILHHTHI